jgi:hypothetical protein
VQLNDAADIGFPCFAGLARSGRLFRVWHSLLNGKHLIDVPGGACMVEIRVRPVRACVTGLSARMEVATKPVSKELRLGPIGRVNLSQEPGVHGRT